MASGDEKYAKKFIWRKKLRGVVVVLMSLLFLIGMMWGSLRHFFE